MSVSVPEQSENYHGETLTFASPFVPIVSPSPTASPAPLPLKPYFVGERPPIVELCFPATQLMKLVLDWFQTPNSSRSEPSLSLPGFDLPRLFEDVLRVVEAGAGVARRVSIDFESEARAGDKFVIL